MGATSQEAQRSGRTPLELARSAAASATASARTPPMLAGHLAATPSLVVIVAASRAEQQRLLTCLPADVAVLVTTSAEQAEELLHTLPVVAPPVNQGPTVRAAERTVSWCGGHSVRLTPLEFALLQTLISEQGRVWSFPELSSKVWATGFVGDGAQVRAVVKRLRRKLADAQAPVLVETVRGAGFRLATRAGPGAGT